MSYRETGNPWGGNFAAPVDKLLGTAFLTVRYVAENLDLLNQLSQSLPALQGLQSPSTLPTTKPTTPGLYWNNAGVLCIS